MTHFLIVGILYFIIFLICSSGYASAKQSVARMKRKLRKTKRNLPETIQQIEGKRILAQRFKRIGLTVICLLLVLHLIYATIFIEEPDFFSILILFCSFMMLMIISIYLKGAGTIDAKPRLPQNPMR